ncbi:MAG: DUF502 domain-containing protein [Puniceicoccaceae bacterium]
MLRNLRNAFVSGLLLLAPVGVTIFVVNFLIQKIGVPTRQVFFFFIPRDQSNNIWVEYALYIAAVLIVVVFITLLGWLSKRLIGRALVNLFERIVDTVPVVRSVYNTVKQIRDTFVQQEKAVFQKAVLLEYPRKGVWVLGFLTGRGKGEIQHRTDADLINIFVPTTPNPTSGFLLMVPREEVVELDMSIPDAMKVIISGGAVVPPWQKGVEGSAAPEKLPPADTADKAQG